MIYSNDNWISIPSKSVFDTAMMQMAINSAKDMYDKGELRIKEFHKLYDDFYSPAPGWNKWYAENVTEPFSRGIDYLYKNGIDPVRSPEGRAYVQNLINKVPKEMLARAKAESAMMDAYLKNLAELKKKGLDNPEMDEFLQNGVTIANYNPETSLPWEWYSPVPYQDMHAATNDWFKDYKPTFLFRGSIDENGKPKIDKSGPYDFSGITEDVLRQSIGDNLNSFMNTPQGKYEVEKIKLQLMKEGEEPTLAEIESRLGDAILDANKSKLQLTHSTNPEWAGLQNLKLAYLRRSGTGGGGSRSYSYSSGDNYGSSGESYARVLFNDGVRNILKWMTADARKLFTDKNSGVFNETDALWHAYDSRFKNVWSRHQKHAPGEANMSIINSFSIADNPDAIAQGLGIRYNSSRTFSITSNTAARMLNRDQLVHRMRHPNGTKMRNDSSISDSPSSKNSFRFTGRVVGFIDTNNRFVQYAEVDQIADSSGNGRRSWYIALPQESIQNTSMVNEQSILDARAFDEQAVGPLNLSTDATNQNETFWGVGGLNPYSISVTNYPQ